MESLPIVDFSALSLERQDSELQNDASIDDLTKKLMNAFTTVGFVYLTNHGVCPNEVSDIHQLAQELFNLPADVKDKYHRQRNGNHGYVQIAEESVNPERPGDLKECFNVTPSGSETYPSEVTNCDKRMARFFDKCWKLSERVLTGISRGLQLQRKHKPDHTETSSLPPASKVCETEPDSLGRTFDYGTITLLFQDDIGGLEVLNRNGEWVDATPVPGSVLVNVADLLQRWTSDRLKSTDHRVKIPVEELRRKASRYSVVYFVHPDDEYVVECLDGSQKYPPITAGDFLLQKLAVSYK